MAEKNSLWKNIRKKAEQNKRTGATPKKPTEEMLRQEKKIKSQYPDGGPVGNDPLYNMQRALELGYTPDETGHWDSVDSETGMWLKSKEHPTAWMEYMYGYALNPEIQKQYQHPVVNPEGYFGENQLQYNLKAQGGVIDGDDDTFKSNLNQGVTVAKPAQDWLANWVQDPEFAARLNKNFPAHTGDLEKKIYGIKEAKQRASAANLKSINKVIPDIVSDIYNTQFLYNTNPEINTGLLSSYKSRLEDPKSIKALEKNLSTNPQGFTDEQGRIIITNEANIQYGPQSVALHELIHKVSERDKTLDKLFKGKFQTPSQDKIDANYDKDEMYPFLMQMRFDNNFQPGEEITPERLKQIRDSGYRNHLFRYYNDDEISKYLNTLASNQTQAPIQYAAQGGKLYPDGGKIYTDDEMQRIIKSQQRNRAYASGNTEMPLDEIIPAILLGGRGFGMSQQSGIKYTPPKFQNVPEDIEHHPYPLKIQERNSTLPIVRKSKQYEDGGKIKSKPEPIYTNDKNDPRLKAYQDSLGIYNSQKQLVDAIHDKKFGKPQEVIDSPRLKAYVKYGIDETNQKAGNKIKPVGFYIVSGNADAAKITGKHGASGEDMYSFRYKKPVQPVIYQDRPKLPEVSTLKSKPIEFEDGTMDIIRTVGSPPPLKEMTPEGHYRINRTHTYGEPNYQVWTEGNKWKNVSKEEYDKISSEKHLTEYKYGGPVTLYKKAQYDPNTGKILEYAGSQGNKYYVTPDTPEGIDFESRLPEFEVIEDTGKYNPNTFGYTAPEYIPSETGLVPNPKYIPLASGALEPVYPEAALLPASLPFKATTRLGKAALFGAELANPLGGFKNFSVKNKVGEVKNQLSKAVKGTSSVLDELKGELLQGKLNRESIKKGNKWLENWIKHPATKEKINTTIDNKIDFVKQFYDNPIEEVDLLNLIRTQSRDFKPNSKEYSLLKQLDNNLQQYLSKKSRSPIHQGNWGVSYQHQYSPKERLNIEIGVEKPLSDRYGSWISRTTKLPQKNRVSTTIHEGTHDWISEEAFKKSGMRNIALQNMDPKIKNDFLEWESYRELGIDPAEKMGKERAYQAYLADPTEQHARIMELRHNLDITPDYKMNEEIAKDIIDWIDKGGSSIDPKFLNVINKDPKKLTELFNRFWMAPPAIIGTGAMQGSQPEQQSQGGHINPYMYYAGGPMQYKRGGLLKDIGLGVADFALGTVGGVTGIQSMKDIISEKQYSDDKFDSGANFAGSIGSTALKLIPVTAPVANVAGVVGGAANKAFGIDAANYNPNQEISDLEKAGNIVGQVGNVASMFMGNTSGTSKFMQGVNQGISFANGGNINNNSLNLQNSMRGKYNSYKKRYSKGGTFHKFGINEIPDSAGYHHENAYGGVPIGPNAMAEGGEFVLDNNYVVSDEVDGMNTQTDEFGRTMAQNLKKDLSKYTMRDLNSKNRDDLRRPMDPLAEQTINQIKQKAMMETEMARAEAQAKEQERQAMVDGALQYAAAGGKLNKDITKIVEEEYAAAYGGYINPKKYAGLNMPYSKGGKLPKEVLRARVESHMSPQEADAYVNQYAEGGGIHIKESKKGTFTAAATKHGKSVQEFAKQVLANKGNYSPAMVKKANFARNAAGWKHAQGGPVVSNVNQDFDLYAQNRGGMMMAQGGNMYAVGGPPDGDPNSLDYITGVSDFMYSPEFLNYWTNTQDKRNVNYENIYDRGNLPLSEERFSPTEGISDFDRTLGNLYSAEKAIFLNTNPDGSVCYMIDGQKVCGPPGQIQAMLANRDRTYQAQAVADVYQNTTGDFAPYNYNNITGSTAARSMSQPDYSGDQNFTDRQNKIRGMVSNAMTRNQSTPVQPIERMQSRNLQQLPTDNTMPGIIGNVENPINFSNTAGFIPSDVMSGKLGTSNAPFPYEEGPINTSIPRDISAKQSVRFTQPMGSDIIEDLPGFTPNQTKVSNEEIGQSYLGTAANPNLPKLTFTQSDATKYGLNPNDVNIIKDPKVNQPNQPNQGLTGLDYVSMLAQAGAGFHQLGLGLKGGDPVNYQRITAEKIDPTVAIALAAEEGRRAQDSAAYLMRQSAPTSGSYMNNLRNLSLQSGKQTALQSAGLRYQADVENARTQTGVNAQNAQIAMQEQIDRLQEKDAARTNITEGLSGIGSSTANMIRDYRINQINQMIAKNIGTNDYKFDPVNQTITYRNQNGEIVTVPAQTVVPSNVAVNVGTGQIQQPGTSQFQTGFNNRLNESFRNRFRGINSGKNN